MIARDKNIILSLAAATLLVATSLTAAQPSETVNQSAQKVGYTKQQTIDLLNKISQDAPYLPEQLSNLLEKINQNSSDASFEENLEKALKMLLSVKITPEQRAEINKVQTLLDKKLQTYKASGLVFARDFNGAFFVDTQDPRFTVTYKDANGHTKQRTYQADISLIGLNIEVALRLNLIFFVGTDFNFAQTNQTIELGTGLQLSPIAVLSLFSDFFSPIKPALPAFYRDPDADAILFIARILGHKNIASNASLASLLEKFRLHDEVDPVMYALSHLNLTFIPFKNIPGGMFIIGAVIGADNCSFSVVTGGTLTPVVDAI